MTSEKDTRRGVTAFGYVTNLTTFVKEANEKLDKNETPFRTVELNALVEKMTTDKSVQFRNKFGKPAEEQNAHYALMDTSRKAHNGKNLLAYYERHKTDKNWTGVFFATEPELNRIIKEKTMFRIGGILFENWRDGLQFLEDLKAKCIPEKWSYQNHQTGMPHPILKSYIENTFEKLLVEGDGRKIMKSDNGKHAIFNTGLLDRFFHEVFIILNTITEDDELSYRNPFIMTSLTDLTKTGFSVDGKKIKKFEDLPEPAVFFTNINDVIFQPSIEIDRDYDRFTHIIEERRERFPKEDQERDSTELARKLDNAINDAIAIAKRNYKMIVPMYRPQEDKLQLLMPIYLSGSFTRKPDFALVLNLEHGIYSPETILPLDAAYQNARLIAKPDELWLNPDDI
jgi:hypothetical protein